MIKVHHINTGTLKPWGFFPLSTLPGLGTGKLFSKGLAVIHCLLIETDEGLILVDTGPGIHDYDDPSPFIRLFYRITGFAWDRNESVLYQIRRMGYDPEAVRHIFLTHLHFDHCGALPDFPDAEIHVYDVEQDFALKAKGIYKLVFREEYWAHDPAWCFHSVNGAEWFGLSVTDSVQIAGINLFFLPLVGHSPGHAAVVVSLPDGRTIVCAGDAYSYHGQVDPENPRLPPYFWAITPFVRIFRVAGAMFSHDREFLTIKHALGVQVEMFPTHDPYDYLKSSEAHLDNQAGMDGSRTHRGLLRNPPDGVEDRAAHRDRNIPACSHYARGKDKTPEDSRVQP